MLGVFKTILGVGFTDKRARGLFAWLAALLVGLVALLFANLCLWLLRWTWSIAIDSPFGLWGVFGAVAISLVAGGVVLLRLWPWPRKAEPIIGTAGKIFRNRGKFPGKLLGVMT